MFLWSDSRERVEREGEDGGKEEGRERKREREFICTTKHHFVKRLTRNGKAYKIGMWVSLGNNQELAEVIISEGTFP